MKRPPKQTTNINTKPPSMLQLNTFTNEEMQYSTSGTDRISYIPTWCGRNVIHPASDSSLFHIISFHLHCRKTSTDKNTEKIQRVPINIVHEEIVDFLKVWSD